MERLLCEHALMFATSIALASPSEFDANVDFIEAEVLGS